MSAGTPSWERTILAWAREGLSEEVPVTSTSAGCNALDEAYLRCEEITRIHSRTFFLASTLLPRPKRRSVRALYAFCRTSDDLVDRPRVDARKALDDWRRLALEPHRQAEHPVALAWTDTRVRYRIPARYVEQLIDGVALDLHRRRYATFDDLAAYCYGVASTVGLMAMHILGFQGEEAVPYAVKLGVALQLTNILRDVGEDWRMGRVYLPQDELAAHGLDEGDIAAGALDERWQGFLCFQIARNRRLYEEALPGIALLQSDGRLAVAAAAELYRDILTDIEAHGGDVFRRRAHLSTWGKVRRLPGIWWRTKRLVPGG